MPSTARDRLFGALEQRFAARDEGAALFEQLDRALQIDAFAFQFIDDRFEAIEGVLKEVDLLSAIRSIAFDACSQGSASELRRDHRAGRRVGRIAYETPARRYDRIAAFQQRFRIVAVEACLERLQARGIPGQNPHERRRKPGRQRRQERPGAWRSRPRRRNFV